MFPIKYSKCYPPGKYKNANRYDAIHHGIYGWLLEDEEAENTCFFGKGKKNSECSCKKCNKKKCDKYFEIV